MDISGSELPNNVGGNGVEGNGQKKFVGRHDVQQNSSSKQSGQLEKNKEDFVGMISVQEREAECLDKKSEEMCGNVCKTQQMLQQELEAIEQGFNELLQQEITKDDLRELTNKLQAIKAQGQEIEQAIDALSRLGNVPQDQIKVLRGQLGYIDDRCQALIHLGRYLNNSQSLRQVLEAIEKEINGLLQQELNEICQEFDVLLQQGTENDGLLVLVNKAQVLSNRLQALDTRGQKIEQAIDALSRLGNVPQDQINALHGQLVNIAQRYHVLDQLARCFEMQQELNAIKQGFNKLLQQGITEDGLRELTNKLQALKAQGQEIEQAIDALSRLGNVPQDQIKVLHGQLVNIAQRYHALDQLARCFEMQQELNAIKQGFNKLLQQEITEDGLRELTNKLQVLEDREQELKQAINVLSRLGNVPQDQIKVLHGQLVNIAQECQALIHLGQYLNNPNQLQQELEAIKHGFNRLLQHGLPAYDVEILNQRFSMLEDREQELKQAINALSRLGNVPQDQIKVLHGQLVNIAQECRALIHLGQYLNNPNQLQQELEAIKQGFNRLLQHGLPAYDVEILNQRFSMLEDREQELEKAINALSRLDNVPQGQINALRNQLIDIALTAVKWRIAPLFKQEGKFASVSNWWSGVNSVQKEVDRLGEKLNSGQEVTQEELQNLLKQMHKLFPDSVGNSLLDRAVKALTAVSAVGAVASGAAAVGTSMTCASIGNAFAGCETACTTLLGMSPVGCGVVAVGLGATAIGGAIYLSRKK